MQPKTVKGVIAADASLPPDTLRNLLQARALIDTHLHQSLELEQLARAANYSPYHFLRLFRRAFAETPHQYLTRRRIERAKELLTSHDLTVTEVCLAVGFKSLGSFSTLFRRHVGHPPQRYRTRVFSSLQLVQDAAPAYVPLCYVMMFGG